jgi:hypothetical protein
MGDPDVSKKPEDYAESWWALEQAGLVAGLVWGECEERERLSLQFDLPELPPRSHHDLEPIHIVAARGNWEVVRQLWRTLRQPSTVREERKPIAHPVLSAGFEPEPLLITEQQTTATLAAHSRRGKALKGTWRILDGALGIEPASGELADVKRGSSFARRATVTVKDLMPRVETARFAVSDDVTTHEFASPAIVLGDARQPVVVDRRPATLSVDNGHFAFTVAPAFLGAVTALERGGVNHLMSSYPDTRPYLWMSPWFGGIHPSLGWGSHQRFVKEQFGGEAVERTGERGIQWSGVKVVCDLQHKDHCWLRIETEYLTVGGSNVLALVQRLVNRTDAPQTASAGLWMWPQVGGSVADNVLYYEQDRPRYEQAGSTDEHVRVLRHRRRSEYHLEPHCGRWAAVANPETGDVLALIASHPDASLDAEDVGKDGVFLAAAARLSLEPNESKETVAWLVLCGSVQEAQAYRALGVVWKLP